MNEQKEQKGAMETTQLVSFTVGKEEYGVPIGDVQEVVRMPAITHLPQTESFLKGVINLRGNIIPVIDMRERFNMEAQEYAQTTRVVVTMVKNKLVGLIVDTVSQVVVLNKDDIEEAPDIIHGISREYIEGIGKSNGTMIIILKIDNVLTAEEVKKISKVAEKGKEKLQEEKEENKLND